MHQHRYRTGEVPSYSLKRRPSDPVFGARPLKRVIQQRIENPVSKLIVKGRFGPKGVAPVDVHEGEFSFGRVVH